VFVSLIWRSKETGIKAQACDEGGPVGQCRRQCVNSKAAVADKDEIASRQPAAELQQALSRQSVSNLCFCPFFWSYRSEGHNNVSTPRP